MEYKKDWSFSHNQNSHYNIFKLYIDITFILKVREYRYIIATRDNLTHIAESRVFRRVNVKSIAQFFWKQIICQYGHIVEVVTDNSSEVKGAFEWLLKRYGILQIRISFYNKYTDRLVEQEYFTICESILKDCREDIKS